MSNLILTNVSLHESFGYKESANPNISPTGLPQPIYSYVKPALKRTLQLEYIFARVSSCEVEVRRRN